MHPHLNSAFRKLKKSLFTLSAAVEENVHLSLKAVLSGDSALADQVRARDLQIDLMEVDFEEECLKILALYQPVAIDLRFAVAVLKINNDLERIGDLAVNIVGHTATLAGKDDVDPRGRLSRIATKAQAMLRQSLDAVVNMNGVLAREVLEADDEVDQEYHTYVSEIRERFEAGGHDLDTAVSLLTISKHLERVADLATNIAEDAIYMVDGEIVRHGRHPATGSP